MIMKVQLSLMPQDPRQVLAYNEDRSVTYMNVASTHVLLRMGPRYKAFFNVTLRKGGGIKLGKELPDQGW